MRYDTVLFDADGTLLDFKMCERMAIISALESFRVSVTEEIVRKYSEINDACWKKLERGEITKAALKTQRFFELCQYFGFDIDPEQLADTYIKRLSEQNYLIEGAEDICRKLSKKCRLYIITNGIKCVQESRLAASGLGKYFCGYFISEEVGFEKPAKGFFDVVAERIPSFDKSKTLIVGDSLTSDIKGGNNAEIDTCWYNPQGVFDVSKIGGIRFEYAVSTLEEIDAIV